MNQGNATSSKTSAGVSTTGGTQLRVCHHVDSASLFQGARELVITHQGERYSLRVTRNEKLILTK